ncbi:MAG TPA: hypothetical protein VJY85_01475 [Candidatus Limnocylindria bacterium]|nr:hypothetical protein [Candidatus Limnocylindria bacterium]
MTHGRILLVIGVLTLALSSTVAISWLAFGRGMGTPGDPLSALERPWIYVSQALMAVAIGFVAARWLGSALMRGQIVLVMFVAWIGELILLALFGTFVASELTPAVAWYYWLIGTGGLMQPMAASVGGVLVR